MGLALCIMWIVKFKTMALETLIGVRIYVLMRMTLIFSVLFPLYNG